MKFQIGDIVEDENRCTGLVCIDWNNGKDEHLSYVENDTAHPDPAIIGHWPKDSIVEASERERRLQTKHIGIGTPITKRPSHTTQHTGPYCAVRLIRQNQIQGNIRPSD